MEQIQKATLTLKGTSAISNIDRTSMRWENINLQLLLGDMYDRFDNFNLKLDSVVCDDDRIFEDFEINGAVGDRVVIPSHYTELAGDQAYDRIVTINLSGLNFLNSTYDSKTNNNSSNTVIGTYKFYESFSKDFNNSIVTFTKGSDRCHLTIEYRTVRTDELPTTGPNNYYPYMTFLFSIYGIPKTK